MGGKGRIIEEDAIDATVGLLSGTFGSSLGILSACRNSMVG